MQLLISLVTFVVLTVAITWFGYRHSTRPARIYKQLGRAIQAPNVLSNQGVAGSQKRSLTGVLGTLGQRLPPSLVRSSKYQ